MADERLRSLASEARRGSPSAWTSLHRELRGPALAVIQRMLWVRRRPLHEAEDIYQRCLIKLWARGLDQYRGDGSFMGFFLRLVVRVALDVTRRRTMTPVAPEAVEARTSPDPSPYDVAWVTELGEKLSRGLETLPEASREALEITLATDLGSAAAAAVLSERLGREISVDYFNTLVSRGRKALLSWWERHGPGADPEDG